MRTPKIGQPLDLQTVWATAHTEHEIPKELLPWQYDNHGPSCVAFAVDELLNGPEKRIAFVAAMHPREGGEIKEMLMLAVGVIEGVICIRMLESYSQEPDDVGTSSLISTAYPFCADKTQIVANIVARLAPHGQIWRVIP